MSEIVAALVAAYEVSVPDAAADVDRLLSELLREDLIVPLAAEHVPASPHAGTSEPLNARQPYQPPVLDIFSDLSPLLANDPPVLIPPLSGNP